jgi:hypothetical protein
MCTSYHQDNKYAMDPTTQMFLSFRRYIILDLTVYEQRLTFVCLYGYNTDVPQFFTDILYKSAVFANTSYLFCGDWNTVQNKSDDTYNVLHDRNINARPIQTNKC